MVDDEPLNLSAFARTFRREFDVRVAGSATEAIAVLEGDGIELILSDYRMPEIDGLALLTTVAARWPNLPRGIVSGGLDSRVRTAHAAGLVGVLINKPWSKDEILAIVAELTGPVDR